jgi:ribonuclease HI
MPQTTEQLRNTFRHAAMELRELNRLFPDGDPQDATRTTAADFPLQAITALQHYFQYEPPTESPQHGEIMQKLSGLKQDWLNMEPASTHPSVPLPKTGHQPQDDLGIELSQRVIVYTDGSCLGNPGPGGHAAIIVVNDVKIAEVSGNNPASTNSRMELQAVISALEFLIPLLPGQNPICVVTDSKYVSDAHNLAWIANWRRNGWRTAKRGPVANQDLWLKLTELEESVPQVEYLWTKGHANDRYNNEADRLAVQQAEELRR